MVPKVCDRRFAQSLALGLLLQSAVSEPAGAQEIVPTPTSPPVTDSAFTDLPASLRIGAPTQAVAADPDVAPPIAGTNTLEAFAPAAGPEPDDLSAEQLLAAYRLCQHAADKPTRLQDLTGGYKLFQTSYRESMAASLGVIGIGEVSGRRDALVLQYHFFRIVRGQCTINRVDIPVVWGVGVASTLHIKELRGGAQTSSLPGIAASVELGRASVTMRMETAGLVGASIEEAFPRAQSVFDFGVQAYADWSLSLDKIRRLMSDQSVTATPQLLITEEALPAIRRAFARPN